MEKRIKKLQLRKETIAVLNGEKMADIIGGGSGYTEHPPCGENAEWIIDPNHVGTGLCVCKYSYVGDPNKRCIPKSMICDPLIPSDNLCTIRTNRGCTNC